MTDNTPTARTYNFGTHSVAMWFDGNRFICTWSPSLPDSAPPPELLPQYRIARDEYLAERAAELGLRIAVVEDGGS